MTESRSIPVWITVGVVVLASIAVSATRAQQQPAANQPAEVFSSSADTYTDATSASCEKGNANAGNGFAGMDPLTCKGVSLTANQQGCTLPRVTLLREVGTMCFYCQRLNPPIKGVIVPLGDVGVAEKQGFRCGADQGDRCMAVCEGNGRFTPPPVATRPSVAQPQAQMAPPNAVYCGEVKPNGPVLTPAQVTILGLDLGVAKRMVATAKTYTDKLPWDAGTQAISVKYFGNASADTQAVVRKNVANVSALLNGVKNVVKVFYPNGADSENGPKGGNASEVVAYVYSKKAEASYPIQVFLTGLFWQQPAEGEWSQPTIIVHEFSHWPSGAKTEDNAYGPEACQSLAALSYVIPTLLNAPRENADSFAYFVYEVASQSGQPK
jgi:Lysine-specific metallo-endopeptidase